MPAAISSSTMSPTTSQPSPSPSSTGATIRLATPSDASQIAHLGATVFTTTFGHSLTPADLSSYLNTSYSIPAITADILNPLITTYIAIAASSSSPSTILGFAQLTRGTSEPAIEGQPKPVELQRLYVSIEAHGLGLGRALVEKVKEKARGEGYETLWLGVWEENVKSQGFYGKVGFEKCGEHGFTMGECTQTDWIMKMGL